MGNWRTVHLIGSLDPAEVESLRAHLAPDDTRLKWSAFGPLSITDGLCGLGDWPAEQIDARGNLAERDYTVAEHLGRLLEVAPSLRLVVHCGDDWESSTCIATIRVQDGQVARDAPEVKAVLGVDEATMTARLFGQLVRPR